MTTKNRNSVYYQTVTVIDSATGWIEIWMVLSASTDLVSNIEEIVWLARYPLPSKIIANRGNKFLAELNMMIQADYGITVKYITSRYPQASSILERVHQTIGNIIRTFKVRDMVLNDESSWDGVLVSNMFALHAMVHTTTQYNPAQLVFGQDLILNTCHKANWQIIKKHKQDLMNKGN